MGQGRRAAELGISSSGSLEVAVEQSSEAWMELEDLLPSPPPSGQGNLQKHSAHTSTCYVDPLRRFAWVLRAVATGFPQSEWPKRESRKKL